MDMEKSALLKLAINKIQAGTNLMLLEIMETDGSAPRKKGTLMFLDEDGGEYGTVGGGAAEYRACQEGHKLLKLKQNADQSFILRKEEADSLGVCGGSIRISFTFLSAEPDKAKLSLSLLQERYKHAASGQSCLYIFGGGHVAYSMADAAPLIGMPFVVYDDREALANKRRFPGAKQVICAPYADALSHIEIKPEDFVIIMTEGHQHDYEMQKLILKTDACYIGVIGSRAKIAFNNEKLLHDGYSQKEVERFYTPVGLQIGAETPGEIAISIAAEIILKRATIEKRKKLLRSDAVQLSHV
ncbi:MAG: XdhC family protein [Eubacteriales bacterium]|nr:XdhC family protein [Eubacteriales bacterium]